MADRPPGYPEQWEADVVLSDGGTVHIRPVLPSDGDRIEALHSRLSAETVYLRFFTPLPRLSPNLLDRFTHVDYVDRLALVAELGDDLVAVGRYDRTPNTDEAEVAFVVDDAHQGRGMGALLLEHLAVAAKENGIHTFVADTLPNNRRMLGVFHDAGFADQRHFADGVVRVTFPIEPTEASIAITHERERRATARSVRRLLAPRSIAVIGASREPRTIGHEVLRNLVQGGFAGPVYPVHPTAHHVGSIRAYPSVIDIPDEVDLAVIVVPAAAVPAVVDECARKRVGGLIIISAGFGELGPQGAVAERMLVEQARRQGMRLIGPNGMGAVNTNPAVRMNATFAPVRPVPGRVAFSSQSGALGMAILDEMSRIGLGVSTFVALGNKADLSSNDLLQYWEDDDSTDVVLLYLESFGNPRTFARVARRVSRRKPIVAVKSARHRSSPRGAGTASGSDAAVDALFRQTGVIRVDTLEHLFGVAQVLAHQPLPDGRRVAIVGNADGPAILAADALEGMAMEVPELTDATQASLAEFLPRAAPASNPVDLGPNASADTYERALRLVLADDNVDAVLAIFIPPLVIEAEQVATALARAAGSQTGKPVVANFLARRGLSAELQMPNGRAVPSFAYPESAALALARVADYAEWRRRLEGTVPVLDGINLDAARLLVSTALAEDANPWLDPASAAELLCHFGISVVATEHVATAAEAVEAAGRLGYPVALKAGAGTGEHNRDIGGVRLDLRAPDEVEEAFEAIHMALGASMGGAVVQPMAAPGVETVISVAQDPSFGPLVGFGVGGIPVELLADQASRVVPLTEIDAEELVRSVRGSPLLFGYRGAPPADVGALEEVLLRVSALVEHVPEVVEIELEPVIVSPTGATAIGAKVHLAPYQPHPELALRRLR